MPDQRIPVLIVELDLDTCGRVFNIAPCTAVVPDGRNNYLQWSEELNVGLWGLGFLNRNYPIADPYGGTNAKKFTATATINVALSYGLFNAPFDAPCHTFVWIKKGNKNTEDFRIYNWTTFQALLIATWNWSTYSGVNCSVYETAAGGWVRLRLSVNTGITAGDSLQIWVCFDTALTYNSGDFTYIFGAQMCFPAYTSDFRYVATVGATVPVNPAVAGTGLTECFNTFPTCQDKTNYLRQTKTYRFSNQRLEGLQLAGEAPTFPVVAGVDLAPTEITPREGLGVRASCTVQLKDFVYNDEGVDPYIATRRNGANWESKSTFARRFLARNANYENRIMRVKSGFKNEYGEMDLSTFVTRSYLIQSVTWPDAEGNWSLTGKDPLRLADADRAVWPARAKIKVIDAVDAVGTLLLCDDADGRLTSDFAANQKYIRIGEEIMLMTAVAVSGTTAAVTVIRATIPSYYPGPQFNIAAEIAAGTSVTPCRNYAGQTLPAVLFELLNSGAGISSAYLPLTEWDAAMVAAGRSTLLLSALIPEPMAVKDLITEITQLNVNVWWNDRQSLVKIQPVLVNPTLAASWTDRSNLLQSGVEVAASSRTRISQSWVYYGHQWPLGQLDKLQSFWSVEGFADLGAEAVEFFGTEAIQETRTRWLPITQGPDALAMAINVVLRYHYGKVGVSVSVDPKDSAVWSGDSVSLLSYAVVDPNGAPTPVIMSVLMAEEQYTQEGLMYRYTGEGQATGIIAPQVRQAAITVDTMVDYNAQTVAEREANCSICADSGQFGDGKPAYTLAG